MVLVSMSEKEERFAFLCVRLAAVESPVARTGRLLNHVGSSSCRSVESADGRPTRRRCTARSACQVAWIILLKRIVANP